MNRIVQAVYDYDAQQADELTIREGHLLWLGADAGDEPGWFKCTLKTFAEGADAAPDQVGNVPENYVDEPVALYQALALYDYDPQAEDELLVYEGSPLDILQECPDGEWVVARMPTDQGNYYGLVPKSYIEPTASSDTAAAAAPAVTAAAPVIQTPPPKPQPTPTPTPVPATPQPAPSAPTGPPRIATALYDYDPQQDDELDINEGETCMILVDAESDPTADPDWCLVRLVSSKPDRSGKEGLVPLNYLEIKTISKSPAAMLTSSPAAAAAAAAAAAGSVKAPPLPPQPTAIPPTHVQSPVTNGQSAPPPLPPTPSANAQRDAQMQLDRERTERERLDRDRAERERAAAAAAAEQEAQRRKQGDMDTYQRQLAAEEERARQRREEERIKQEEAERQRAVTAAATAAANAKPPGLPPRPPVLPDRPTSAAVSRVAAVSAQNTGSSAASSNDRPDPSQVRVWLDASGIHKTEAAFLDLVDGKIKLFKTNGVKIDVPVTALSPQDQATAYKLKGLPVPAHLSGEAPARGASPALPSPRAASAAAMANGATTYNGMDWSDFLVSAGVEAGEARGAAQRFAAEKLDESTVPDLNRDILKGLGVREGDILRILKYVSTYRTKREREHALEAENLARIESYAKNRGGSGIGALSAGMSSMSVGGGRGSGNQLKDDEELARRLQQEELLRAGVSSVPIPPTTRKEAPPAASRRTQPAHPAATSSTSSSSSNLSAALAARRQSAPQSPVVPSSSTGGSIPGINARLGAPPPMPTIAQAVSAVPSHTLQQQQPMRPAAAVSLPAPLIPTNTSASFVPTAVTGPSLAQQQQMQAQQLAQQQMLMQQQQQQQMQAQNQANMMMLASAMMSGQRPAGPPQGVASNATGRAQWQNATPDNPFGKPLAPNSTGSSSLAPSSMGMSRSVSQPAHMSGMSTGNPGMNPAMLAGAGGAAMQYAHQNPAMAHMMVQQGVGFAQQNPQLMHQATGMAVQHGPGMMHAGSGMLAASVRPGMPGMQGPMGMQQQQQMGMMQGGQGQQQQQQMDQYAAFRQFQGQR